MREEGLRRRVHLVVPGVERGTFLVAHDGALPELAVVVGDDETTLIAALRAAANALSLRDVPVLDALLDDEDTDAAAEAPAVVVLDAPPGSWCPPNEFGWARTLSRLPDAPVSRARLTTWLAELSRSDPLPAGRAAWCRPGWWAHAEEWIREHAAVTGPVEAHRWCSISAVMRAPTSTGRVWFKSVFPHFWHEPALTLAVAQLLPGSVPSVIAADHERGWLLLEDVGDVTARESADADAAIIDRLIVLQRASIGRTDDLIARGAHHRPLARLPSDLDTALRDPITRDRVAVTDARIDALVEWVGDMAASGAALGLPETLIHGDFHPGNVAVVDGSPVIFDWSDAAVAHPLVDYLTWVGWSHDDERIERSWRAFVDGWADMCPPAAVDAIRPQLVGLFAAYHTVSYARLVAAIEPTRRHELAEGLAYFFRVLDEAVPA